MNMNGITYGVTEECYTVGSDRRVAYGIAVYADADTTGTASIVASVRDISSDKKKVEEFVRLCNSGGVSLIHFSEMVDDFLWDDVSC